MIMIDPTGEAPMCPPGQRAVPLKNYEKEFPKYFACRDYQSRYPRYAADSTERCMLDCTLKNIAMCEALGIGGAGIGATFGAVASIPSI